jgi:hypothetical protein
MTNWYKPVIEAERHPEPVITVRPGKAPLPGDQRKRPMTGKSRIRAQYDIW